MKKGKILLIFLWCGIGTLAAVIAISGVLLIRENISLKAEYKELEAEYEELQSTQTVVVASDAREEETNTEEEEKMSTEIKEETSTQIEQSEISEEADDMSELLEGTEEVPIDEKPTECEDGVGKISAIPEEIRQQMQGISMPEGTTQIGFDDLSYLTIPHYNFEGEVVDGHMIVNNAVAEDVINIFKELYDIKYPIQRMELIDKFDEYITERFDTLDRSSMGRNNTSCFCYRVVSGTDNMSNHAWGRAIDLNPLINPWVQGDGFSPMNAGIYVDRSKTFDNEVINRAVIHAGDEVVQIFEKYGWSWGGYWSSQQDYQHFAKEQ